ncbi:MAG: EFR1 family ferrodoxin [Oscillospiraceae bacterium]|nr:EFR1 family ferrodoxin [Oscillospiraceae bacterium]
MDRVFKAVYFSATGTTKKVVEYVAQSVAESFGKSAQVIDFTLPQNREAPLVFEKNDVVFFGTPVIAGRVPNVLLPFLRTVQGGGATAVVIALYGNRNYDDALIEQRDLLENAGMKVVAGGAFIGEHSFSTVLGAGRPDEKDMEIARGFADRIAGLLKHELPEEQLYISGSSPQTVYYQPRDRKGNPIDIRKVKPKVSDKCIKCGHCAEICPMGSIDPEDVTQYRGICIKCCACIKGCPRGARYYDDPGYLYHKTELEEMYTRRAEPELFF